MPSPITDDGRRKNCPQINELDFWRENRALVEKEAAAKEAKRKDRQRDAQIREGEFRDSVPLCQLQLGTIVDKMQPCAPTRAIAHPDGHRCPSIYDMGNKKKIKMQVTCKLKTPK